MFTLDQARKVTYIRSIICNTDIIPRLSFGSLYDLKTRIKAIVEDNSRLKAKLNKLVSIDRTLLLHIYNSMQKDGLEGNFPSAMERV